jgi:hypothetical protein
MARPKKRITAQVTWLGEDHLHEEGNGPRKNTWNGIEFIKGEPVEIDNPRMIEKAKGNPFYEVDGVRSESEEAPETEVQPEA